MEQGASFPTLAAVVAVADEQEVQLIVVHGEVKEVALLPPKVVVVGHVAAVVESVMSGSQLVLVDMVTLASTSILATAAAAVVVEELMWYEQITDPIRRT